MAKEENKFAPTSIADSFWGFEEKEIKWNILTSLADSFDMGNL